jgi:hypothetical protein
MNCSMSSKRRFLLTMNAPQRVCHYGADYSEHVISHVSLNSWSDSILRKRCDATCILICRPQMGYDALGTDGAIKTGNWN